MAPDPDGIPPEAVKEAVKKEPDVRSNEWDARGA